MAPTENVFWEARYRPNSFKEVRRHSTTVDSTGCIVQRGFVIPSRTSSFDSVAAVSSVSSLDTGTPASPIKDAPPGFSWPRNPTGSFERPAQTSFHRSTRSTGNLDASARLARPSMGGRRQTWQSNSTGSTGTSRWEDDELADITCEPPRAPRGYFPALPPLEPRLPLPRNQYSPTRMRRTKSEQASLKVPKTSTARLHPGSVLKKEGKLCDAGYSKKDAVTETAIASDSEDEDPPSGHPQRHGIRTGPNMQRIGYAERRARNDARAAKEREIQRQDDEAPEAAAAAESAIASDSDEEEPASNFRPRRGPGPPRTERITYAERRARNDARASQHRLALPMELQPQDQDDSAVISDDDECDHHTGCSADCLCAALNQAIKNRTRNSETARVEVAEDIVRPSSGARVRLEAIVMETRVVEPLEPAASLDTETAKNTHIARRELRPSRSQPRPVKGVLKSRSHSRGHSPNGKAHADVSQVSTQRGRLQLDEITVRFAPVA